MIRKIFIVLVACIATSGYAQRGSSSPYSFYGIGDQRFKGTAENQAMGGISIYSDSIHLNLNNPAAYSDLHLTVYSVGGAYTNKTLKSKTQKENASTVYLDYLALGFPLIRGKLGAGFGLMPYTSVGYNLENRTETTLDQFKGEGGANRAFLSAGYKITNNFSLGATANYNFGKITNEYHRVVQDIQRPTTESNTSQLSGFDFNLALNYKTRLNDKLTLRSSVMYAPETTLTSENTRIISVTTVNPNNGRIIGRTENVNLDSLGLRKVDLNMPEKFTVGVGIGQERKWFAGAEYEWKKSSKFDNPFISVDGVSYDDATRFSAGGFFIPDYSSFSNYWKRIVYRLGVRYEETGLRVKNVPLNDFGISFGLGLPLGAPIPTTNSLQYAGMFSNINVGVELGRRGTTTYGRIQEDYLKVNISLSLNDKWFVKRKYD
ncbi:hypothetical protein [Sinomicrobium weinanense]|uniref:Long-chain fatty acid transport protein n=1 Tax=Sinomicrobium weinanense TaxID=2842200 RepID=A0A926Q545_9FLAO|nr:hypothetical protein [Sinomicrobium weinanense]MBC9797575.1 hypothetical protein [Sinomicrobium weinanense]MBU3123642.1 hypothetical protein [Sinomicrobium weinanense]